MKKKLDLIDIKKFKKSKKKLVMITAYDYVSGYIVNESSADIILVGDSYGMTTLGYDQTSLVSMEDMDRATRSINNVKLKTFLVADLPYKTYETNEQALKNSKILINSGADAIKLEYVTIRTLDTFKEIKYIKGPFVLLIAAYVGDIRLIDNYVFR